MIYQGSKARLKKDILPILQKCIDDNNIGTYIEPFVGGANIIDSIERCRRVGSDINYELIQLLKYMQEHPELEGFPEDCSFEHYRVVRSARYSDTFPAWYTAGIGYFASYGGRYFDGGYARDPDGIRNHYVECLTAARKQALKLKGIEFHTEDYLYYSWCENCVFYLDPPYKGTKPYNGKNSFNYDEFYAFCRKLSKKNWVFISEYAMPDDFKCIWQKQRKVFQKSDRLKADVAVEKLFVFKEGLARQAVSEAE